MIFFYKFNFFGEYSFFRNSYRIFSSLQNLNLFNFFQKSVPKKMIPDKIINIIYDWSYNFFFLIEINTKWSLYFQFFL